MAWTNKQKQLAVRAAGDAGLTDEHRKLVLRQFHNSMFDAQGRAAREPTSTSKRLNNSDFEHFMAFMESQHGNQIMHYPAGHWRKKSADDLGRFRRRCLNVANELMSRQLLDERDGLTGWIKSRVTDGRTSDIEQLDYHELRALHDGLRAYGRRNGVNTKG